MLPKQTFTRFLSVLFLAAVLLGLMVLSFTPTASVQAGLLNTPTPGHLFVLPDVRTPLPPEMLANRFQTNGIIAGGVVLVLIIVIGTVSSIRHK